MKKEKKKHEIWYVGCCCSQVANVDRKINGTNDFDDDENKTERIYCRNHELIGAVCRRLQEN